MKQIFGFVPAAAVCCLLVTGCSNENDVNEPGVEQVIDPVEQVEYTVAEKNAVAATQGFDYDFLNAVCASESYDENVVVSPLSAQMLLSMMANVTDASSTAEIIRALGCDDISSLNSFNGKCLRVLPHVDASTKIALANSVWFHNAYTMNQAFVATANDFYDMEVFGRDFDVAGPVVDEVNGWCNKKTSGLIPNIINGLDGVSIMINALYFKGEWANPFDEAETEMKDFNGQAGVAKVKMMHKKGMQHYAVNNDYEAVKLELGNGAVSIAFVLPEEGKDMDVFMKGFDYVAFKNERYSDRVIDLSLVKCNLAPGKVDLQTALMSLGVNGVFAPGQISLFEEALDGQFRIYQKSAVEFSEKGAEGASVTWNTEVIAPGAGDVAEVPVVTFDRPYLFFITEAQTGVCLMAGRVMNF